MLSATIVEVTDGGCLHNLASLVECKHDGGLPQALSYNVFTWLLILVGGAPPVIAVAANATTEDLSREVCRRPFHLHLLHQLAPTPTKAKRSSWLTIPIAMPSTFRPLIRSTSCRAVTATACSPFIAPMYAPK